MPRIRIQDIRRQELIEATIDALHQHGFTDLTVAQISKAAGLSAGNVHYYFGGKQELLAATMRWLLTRLREVTTRNLAAARTPRERIAALIDSNFAPELFTPAIISAWVHFWAQAPHYPELKRLQQINAARVRSNLLHALRQWLPAVEAERVTAVIQALMDGTWIQAAQTPGGWQPEEGRRLARFCFDRLVPVETVSTPHVSKSVDTEAPAWNDR